MRKVKIVLILILTATVFLSCDRKAETASPSVKPAASEPQQVSEAPSETPPPAEAELPSAPEPAAEKPESAPPQPAEKSEMLEPSAQPQIPVTVPQPPTITESLQKTTPLAAAQPAEPSFPVISSQPVQEPPKVQEEEAEKQRAIPKVISAIANVFTQRKTEEAPEPETVVPAPAETKEIIQPQPEKPPETVQKPEPEPEPEIVQEVIPEPKPEPEPAAVPPKPEQKPVKQQRTAPTGEVFAPQIMAIAMPKKVELNQLLPSSGPVITVTSPDTVSYYHSNASVKGKVSGFSGKAQLSWQLAGSSQSGSEQIVAGGNFSFTVDTTGMTGTQLVRITASANGSENSEKILLLINDNTGPAIIADSAGKWLRASDNFTVTGKVINAADDRRTNEIKSVTADLIGITDPVPLDISRDGSFNLSSSAPLFGSVSPSDAVLRIQAEDYNSNFTSEYFLILTEFPDDPITLTSPANGDLFSDEIIVKGTAPGFSEVFWDIPGSVFSGTVKTETGNSSFSFPITLSGITDNCLLRVSASKNGKTALATRNLYNMHKPPAVEIKNPSSGDFYSDSILLKGNIVSTKDTNLSDKSSSGDTSPIDKVKSLAWGIPGTENIGNLIFLDTDGSFSLDIGTSDYSGMLPVEISTEDYNGNIGHNFLLLQDGKRKPEFFIASPSDNSYFGAYIYIKGTVKDPYNGTSFGGIKDIRYNISSVDDFNQEPVTGSIQPDRQNNFNAEIPTNKLSGRYQLSLEAEAKNGNTAETVYNIEKGGSDITGVSLNYASGELTADWDSIPGVKSYSLYMTNNGEDPDETNAQIFKNVSSPVALNGITTGHLYKIRIKAETDYGILWSGSENYIPADNRTFNLKAEGDFKQIKLNWKDIPASDTYSVYRSIDKSDNFSLVRISQEGTSFIDKDVSFGVTYQYYITPEGYDYSKSNTASASILKAPEERIKELNQLSSFTPVDIDVTGSYAYVAAGADGFRIVDLTTPEHMAVTGMLDGPECNGIRVRGDYAYITCGSRGLYIINIMDPVSPFTTGNRPTTDAKDVELKDNYAFVSDGSSGIRIIDVSDARFPSKIASIEDHASDCLCISGNLMISGNSDGASIYDISNPLSPGRLSSVPAPQVVDIAVSGQLLYILSEKSGLLIYNLSAPDSPQAISSFRLNAPEALIIEDSYAYVADGKYGLKVINISNPAKPFIFDSFKTGKAVSIDDYNDNVIIAEDTGLSVFRAFLRGVSYVINVLNLNGKAHGISIFRDLAFLPGKSAGLHVFNISTPSAPIEKQIDNTPAYSGITAVYGTELYTTTAPDTVSVFDLSGIDSGSFTEKPLAEYKLQSEIRAVSVTDNLLCAVTKENGVHFFRDGSEAGAITAADARCCVVKNNTAYISEYKEGLQVWDISDPAAPELYATLKINGATDISTDHDLLILTGGNGVYIYDISDRQKPEQLGYIKSDFAEKTVIHDGYLYLAEGYRGLSIYSLKDPGNPELVSSCDTIYAVDLAITGSYALVTDITGLSTVKIFIPDWVK